MQNNNNTIIGTVVESLPNTLFRVEFIDNNLDQTETKTVLSYLSGKMRIHRIKVLVGDKVEVLIDKYGGKGRIIKRV
jgi:translation initiation factor IF-1